MPETEVYLIIQKARLTKAGFFYIDVLLECFYAKAFYPS